MVKNFFLGNSTPYIIGPMRFYSILNRFDWIRRFLNFYDDSLLAGIPNKNRVIFSVFCISMFTINVRTSYRISAPASDGLIFYFYYDRFSFRASLKFVLANTSERGYPEWNDFRKSEKDRRMREQRSRNASRHTLYRRRVICRSSEELLTSSFNPICNMDQWFTQS